MNTVSDVFRFEVCSLTRQSVPSKAKAINELLKQAVPVSSEGLEHAVRVEGEEEAGVRTKRVTAESLSCLRRGVELEHRQ